MKQNDKIRPYRHGKIFRCDICGKFISYNEINNTKVKIEYTPDTQITKEETIFTHFNCLNRLDSTYTSDGLNWKEIIEDHL